jgi:chaperone BCS1
MNLDMEMLFKGSLLISLITYLGYQLKNFPILILKQIKKRIIFYCDIEQRTDLYLYLEYWILNNPNIKKKKVKAEIEGYSLFKEEQGINNKKDITEVSLVPHDDLFSIKHKGKRLLITKNSKELNNTKSIDDLFFKHYTVQGFFAEKQIKDFLKDCCNKYKEDHIETPYGNIDNSCGDWVYNFKLNKGKDINNLFLEEKNTLINDIKDFIDKESWYNKRNLNYRRGYLLYGEPGNGKTSLCLAISKKFNRDIYFLNLNDLEKDSHLFSLFVSIKNNSIIVIEDIDAIFANREEEQKISFSSLLNCLDGVLSKYGVILIMTTNHIDKLDWALIREGRVDKKIHIPNPPKKIVEEYLSVFYEKEINLKEYNKDFSMAKIQELCLENKNEHKNLIFYLEDNK